MAVLRESVAAADLHQREADLVDEHHTVFQSVLRFHPGDFGLGR